MTQGIGAPNAASLVRDGLSFLKQQDIDRAIARFSQALKLQPRDPVVYRLRGRAFLSNHQFDAAIADFDRAINLAAEDSSTYYFRGRAWHQNGNRDRAIADFDSAVRPDPNNLKALQQRNAIMTEPLVEATVFRDATVKITRTIAVLANVTYSIRAISSIRVFRTEFDGKQILTCLLVMLSSVLFSGGFAVFVFCFGFLGLVAAHVNRKWILGLVTTGGEVAALTGKPAYLFLVKAKLEEALKLIAEPKTSG